MGASIGVLAEHLSFDRHGGANYSKHLFAQGLEDRGFDVTVHTLNYNDENCVPVEHDYELRELALNRRSTIANALSLMKQLGGLFDDHDLIHVYVPGVAPLVALRRSMTGDATPLTATLNNYTPFCSSSDMMADGCWSNCTLRKKVVHSRQGVGGGADLNSPLRMVFNDIASPSLLNEVDRLFCLSPTVEDIYAGVGVSRRKMTAVPNMIDDRFVDRRAPETSGSARRFLYVGRVDATKGVADLVEAVALSGRNDLVFDVVGDNVLDYGTTLEEHREMAEELGVDDRVKFHGWVDYLELPPHYERADAFVHPGTWPEPFGRTIIEALGHGLPVICSDVGAPEWVAGRAGMSYRAGDATDLADTIDELADNDTMYKLLRSYTHLERLRFEPGLVLDAIEREFAELGVSA